MKNSLLMALLCIAFLARSPGQEWTRFRGPNGTGISEAKTIPVKWSESDYNWKVALPGTGHSSPVLWGSRIFLLSGNEDEGGVIAHCVDARDGKLLWERGFNFGRFRHHKFNSFASSSPAVDAERVYFCWATPERYTLVAFTHEGGMVWEKDLGPFVSQHGGGTSPIVYGDMVVLANEQDGKSFLIAVDAKSGQTRWKTDRESVRAAYGTPCVYQPEGGRPQLIFTSQAHGIGAVDPATGKLLWEYKDAFDKRSCSSPVVADGLLIGSCGSGAGGNYVVAVRPPDSSSSQPELAYEVRRSAPYVPCTLALKNLLFLWGDGGIVTCVEATTGEEHWRERVGGDFYGSPVCVDGRLYCISTSGEVVVLEAGKEFKVLARNELGEKSHTTPAIAGGKMYIRTAGHLISLGG